MVASSPGRRIFSLPAALLLLGVSAMVVVIAVPRIVARRAESAARAAWAPTMPMEALARPREPRGPNGAALALEQAAASLGIPLAPRHSSRSTGAPTASEVSAFATLHADLSSLLAGGSVSSMAAPLATWLRDSSASLDALAVDLAAAEPPRWESTDRPAITRNPSPLERCDRLVIDAARLAARPAAQPLSPEDEHLTRPGTPRLESVVLLDEALLLGALVEGRGGDMQRALRFVAASIRLDEGLMTDADPVTLGVLASLARLRLAVLRDLAPPVDSSPFLGPDLESRYREAVLVEAAGSARALQPGDARQPAGLGARAANFVFSGPSRAARASTLLHLQLIADAAGPASSRDADLSALAADVTSTTPAWDSLQGDYLRDIVGLWSRVRRVKAEAEFTKRLLAARVLMLTTGDQGLACREIADVASEGQPVMFGCESDPEGRLSLVMTTTAPLIGRPSAFEPNLAALLMPSR